MSNGFRFTLFIVIAVSASLIALSLATGIIVNWNWFSSIGYLGVYRTIVLAKVAIFSVIFAISAIAIWINGAVAHKSSGRRPLFRIASTPWSSVEELSHPPILEHVYRKAPWPLLITAIAMILGGFIAAGEIGNWNLVLRFIHQVPYGKSDPVFGHDISFYLFSLPVYFAFKTWILTCLAFSVLIAGGVYWVHGELVFGSERRSISRAVISHASVLIGLFLAVEAFAFWLGRYQLLFGDNGVVVGVSYTNAHVDIPLLSAAMALAIAGAVACLLSTRSPRLSVPLASLVVVFGFSLIISPVFSALFERLHVKPNELSFEAPYIARNIALTRDAYKLNNVVAKPFPADETLTYRSLQNDRPTIDNIRLWDQKPLLDTYAQLQEIRTYYKFYGADIDRYQLGGKYQQVMLSAREIMPSLLPENAQTWVNLHVLFTHGNGAVMSPVTQTTPEGLPNFYLQNIPPIASGGPPVREPRIYFGEGQDSYVIVKASTPEFDYPKGDKNVYASYRGTGGIQIGSLAKRSLFSWYLGDLNILLSEYITGDSRIMIYRNIRERVNAIAPFLRLDSDPYIVVSGGRLYWLQDAYTVSEWFPYSKAVDDSTANYIRNSVKVVIDAYNGTVNFYLSDPSDPIIQTYTRIFPDLFKPLTAMPADLQKHIRYPEDFFQLQAEIYRAYHMNAPEVFYNREDLWQFPRQATSSDAGDESRMAPYFINIRLPGESRTEFVLMLPMVPSQRENMIAWLAARSDPPNYGKLIVYQFPKEKLVYGPFQIEALINQNTEISQQISLWNQMGSRVIRGNLLVVPIGNSILYVTPLYLRAQTGQLPELKRVIAVYGDDVVMEQTLSEALAALFKVPNATPGPPSAEGPAIGERPQTKLMSNASQQALDHYQRAVASLKAGDWARFGSELDALRQLLVQMNAQQAGAAAPTSLKPVHP